MARSRYIVINKIIKGPGTSFQSPALSQKQCLSDSTLVFDQMSFWQYLEFKRNKHKYNSHYTAMPMVTSQILKFVDFTKTKRSGYLENETFFFLRIKKFIKRLLYDKKQFSSGGNLHIGSYIYQVNESNNIWLHPNKNTKKFCDSGSNKKAK